MCSYSQTQCRAAGSFERKATKVKKREIEEQHAVERERERERDRP
jgi:hypothetical protein